jgi:hypothetical protein
MSGAPSPLSWHAAERWPRWCLYALTGWGVLLSLETWLRLPGAGPWPAFPERLERSGRLYLRGPAAADQGEPPPGLTLLAAADYRPTAPGGGLPIRLRLLTLPSSGTGVAMPVEAIGPALVGVAARGQCVVLDPSGTLLAALPSNAAWQSWMARQRPDRLGRIAWLAGLRPYRANTCLWESLP